MQTEVLAVVEASAARRWIGVAMLACVGLIVLYVAVATPPEPVWQVFLIIVGAAALWLAQRTYQSTAYRIELTETDLRSSNGQVLCRIEDVEGLDRGVFAFKPSNGFLLRTRTPGSRAWYPGLWWRMGRRIGIGGVTPGSQTKFMAEMISAMIAERERST